MLDSFDMRMVQIAMSIAEYPPHRSDDQFRMTREVQQQRPILNPVVRNAQQHIGAPLYVQHMKAIISNEELHERPMATRWTFLVAIRFRNVRHFVRIPRSHHQTTRVRIRSESIQNIIHLIESTRLIIGRAISKLLAIASAITTV